MMCNCTIQHEPSTPTKSDTQFLCKGHANVAMISTKDNLSVPTGLHITNSIGNFPDETRPQLPTAMNSMCELEEAVHDFPVVDGSTELCIVTAPTIVDQHVPQCITSLSEDNLNIDHGMSKYRQYNEGTRISYVGNIKAVLKNSSMQTETTKKVQEMPRDLTTPTNHQTHGHTVQNQHHETSV